MKPSDSGQATSTQWSNRCDGRTKTMPKQSWRFWNNVTMGHLAQNRNTVVADTRFEQCPQRLIRHVMKR
eukprot:1895997-Alexandrium_andersonii.AAC.1